MNDTHDKWIRFPKKKTQKLHFKTNYRTFWALLNQRAFFFSKYQTPSIFVTYESQLQGKLMSHSNFRSLWTDKRAKRRRDEQTTKAKIIGYFANGECAKT